MQAFSKLQMHCSLVAEFLDPVDIVAAGLADHYGDFLSHKVRYRSQASGCPEAGIGKTERACQPKRLFHATC